MPIECSVLPIPPEASLLPILLVSGLALRADTAEEPRSILRLLLSVGLAGTPMFMLGVVTVPRARLTVLTWLSSERALLIILAAASPEEKRGGSEGRCRGLLLKNKGETGSPGSSARSPKLSLLRVCLVRGGSLRRLLEGCEVGPGLPELF